MVNAGHSVSKFNVLASTSNIWKFSSYPVYIFSEWIVISSMIKPEQFPQNMGVEWLHATWRLGTRCDIARALCLALNHQLREVTSGLLWQLLTGEEWSSPNDKEPNQSPKRFAVPTSNWPVWFAVQLHQTATQLIRYSQAMEWLSIRYKLYVSVSRLYFVADYVRQ